MNDKDHDHHGPAAAGATHPDLHGPEMDPVLNRRSFLTLAGFSFAGLMISGCQRPGTEKAIPYLIKPEEITPGKAYWYASTCAGCSASCGLLVKNRDGRPIKLEGHPDHPLSAGGLCVVGQAGVLGLYDSLRLKHPLSGGRETSWEALDANLRGRLEEIRSSRGAVRFLTGTLNSPTARRTLDRFLGTFADGRHVVYDSLSCSAILAAHELTHGARLLPRYRFAEAEVVASFDADFLGTWISPVEHTAGYRAGRTLQGTPPKCSYHFQAEARLSMTGAKADRRLAVAPSEMEGLMLSLARRLEQSAGRRILPAATMPDGPHAAALEDLAERLMLARGRSLVLCGSNNLRQQWLANYMNHLLDNYGRTLDIEQPSRQRQGNDRQLQALLEELRQGRVAALFIHGCNPVYELPAGEQLAESLQNVPLVVSFSERVDETSALAHLVCPEHHFLESWQDGEPVAGVAVLTQPAIHPLGGTRSLLQSLAAWMGEPRSALEMIQEQWQTSIHPRQIGNAAFQPFWDQAVHDGFVRLQALREAARPFAADTFPVGNERPADNPATMELVLYPKVSLLDGRHAHNAWLQEVPDPISKITWDNYVNVSPAAAAALGIGEGDVVRLTLEGNSTSRPLELPAHIQVGQQDRTVAVALGYGRQGTERFTRIGPQWWEARNLAGHDGRVGRNAAGLLSLAEGTLHYTASGVRLERTGVSWRLAATQTWDSTESPPGLESGAERAIIQQTTLQDYTADPSAGSFPKPHSASLWPEQHQYKGHHWGMVIDLSACTGCSACVVSCQAENNIPVVGKDEVLRNREMHWLRIDRYYSEKQGQLGVAHQPMLCQHCDNAPCETVCPVLATVHSEEGLNQQVYNRCVGTRYCANNCPYKMRRFNWFDYARQDRLADMVLNPDVTVRSRGVMEKCSFCVQRIQEARIESRRTGTPTPDGGLQTACQQSCPARAIEFGDMNDPQSRVAQLIQDPRHYRVLAELEVRPSVGYLTLVRNSMELTGENPRG